MIVFINSPLDKWPWLNKLKKIIVNLFDNNCCNYSVIFGLRPYDIMNLNKQNVKNVIYSPHSFPFITRPIFINTLLLRVIRSSFLYDHIRLFFSKRQKLDSLIIMDQFGTFDRHVENLSRFFILPKYISYYNSKSFDFYLRGIPSTHLSNTILIIDQPLVSDGIASFKKISSLLQSFLLDKSNGNKLYFLPHPRTDGLIGSYLKKHFCYSIYDYSFIPQHVLTVSSMLSFYFASMSNIHFLNVTSQSSELEKFFTNSK